MFMHGFSDGADNDVLMEFSYVTQCSQLWKSIEYLIFAVF